MSTNPLPARIVPPDYCVDANGVWRDLGEKRPPLRLTTTAAYVIALLRDVNAADWSVEIEFTNPDGQPCTLLVPYTHILGRRDLSQQCTAAGLFVLPRGENEFAEYLAQCAGSAELPRHRLTTKLGLNLLPDAVCPDRLAFVLPGKTLLPNPETVPAPAERLVFRPPFANPAFAAYASAGTLEESRELLTLVRDDPVAVFILSASAAAPFLEMAGVDSIIVHLHGKSSTGKTTRLQLVAMLWGKPLDPQTAGNDVTLIERWHGTANAAENQAATHNGMVLCKDELGGNEDPGFSIYNQTSGRGKSRMTRDGGVQMQRKWSLLSVSTGEVSLTDRLEAASGKPAKTGEVIRGLSIPLDGLPAYEGMPTEAASQHVQALKTQLTQVYGTIGPAFAQYVIDTFGTASDLRVQLQVAIDRRHAELVDYARAKGKELEPPQIRALRRFALMRVVGEWAAVEYLPFSEEEIDAAIKLVAMTWLDSLPVLNDEDRIVGQVRDWVIRHLGQMIRYGEEIGDENAPYIPSVTKGIRYRRWTLLTEADFAEACDGTSTMVAGKLLKRLGILDGEGGKHKKRHQLGGLGLPETYFYSILTARLLPETEQQAARAEGPLPATGFRGARNRPAPRQDDEYDDPDPPLNI